MFQKSWRPSLQACFAAIILLVVAPTLGVVAMALLQAGNSYREASTAQLLETARVVSQSVENELDVTARLVRGLDDLLQDDTAQNVTGHLAGPDAVRVLHVRGEQIEGGDQLPTAVAETVLAAARSGSLAVSNVFTAAGSENPQLAFATPDGDTDGDPRVVVQVLKPADLVRALSRGSNAKAAAVLAIVDGTGLVINRSVDGERAVGKPVPSWDRLVSLGANRGSFRALTLEGAEIVFAFDTIAGTPGWVAVVGEPAARFDSRWQRPLIIMLSASGVTILIGLLLAFMLAKKVLGPIRYLAHRAQAVADARSPHVQETTDNVPASFVAEFETLRVSLDAAENVLRDSLLESQQAEAIAKRSVSALEGAERLARMGSWTLDLTSGEFTCSDMLYELNGADPHGPPLKVEDLSRLMAPESYARLNRAISTCFETGEPYGIEVEHLHKDGHSFTAFVQGKAIRDDEGSIVKLTGTVQDISERIEERERLAALAGNLPSGVIFRLERGPDARLKIAYVSAGTQRLIGLPATDIMNNASLMIERIDPADRQGLREALARSQASGEVLDHQFRMTTTDGQRLWMHVRASIRTQSDGCVIWDGIARDMTREQEAADVLQAAKDSAEAAERTKSDFLATMSHEIRTPMNTVIGMTRLALQTELNPKQRNYLQKIDRSASVLLGIINDILDFSKIEAGGLVLEGTTFTLESVLESVSTVTALKAEEKGLELTFAINPMTPSLVKGDPLRLGQVLTNLVGNAVKFTTEGDIIVSVRPLPIPENAGGVKLEFSVRDTGIGLTHDQIEGLFRPFTQADTDTSRRYGGTGLGLAICKRLVELMGGEIRVDSEYGKGSTFTFTVSLEHAENAETPATAATSSHAMRGRRILICDDNESARMALDEMVRSFGLDTQSVDGGAKAISILREEAERGRPFDMVLLDWRMPGLDGIETARLIKSDYRLLQMPAVLMVTAYGHEIVTQAVKDIGLQGMLLKPVTQSMMFNMLHGVLFAPNTPTETPIGTAGEIRRNSDYRSLAGRRVLVVDDNTLNREVATDFLELVGIRVETAVNGLDALRKMEAADYDVVLMDMHMPEMNGLEAVMEIRRRPQWKTLPVIALTAQAREEDHQASIRAGMTAHLTKPIDETALYEKLMSVLSLSSADTAAPAGNPDDPVDTASNVIDMGMLLKRFGGNRQRVERLLDGFVRDFGEAPGALDDLLHRGEIGELAELVHQIKGGAGYLGTSELSQVADKLELAARQNDGDVVTATAPLFGEHLRTCLSALTEMLSRMRATKAADEEKGLSVAQALTVLEELVPLVERGDFAAKALLDTLATNLTGPQQRSLVKEAQDLFEDLELSESVAALNHLKAMLLDAPVAREG